MKEGDRMRSQEMDGILGESNNKKADKNIRSHKEEGTGVMVMVKGNLNQCKGTTQSRSGAGGGKIPASRAAEIENEKRLTAT